MRQVALAWARVYVVYCANVVVECARVSVPVAEGGRGVRLRLGGKRNIKCVWSTLYTANSLAGCNVKSVDARSKRGSAGEAEKGIVRRGRCCKAD